jgi:hypothetical protein
MFLGRNNLKIQNPDSRLRTQRLKSQHVIEINPPPLTPATETVYRCIQCGIESKEATCFIGNRC